MAKQKRGADGRFVAAAPARQNSVTAWIGRNWQVLTSISSGVVALASIGIAIWSGNLTRQALIDQQVASAWQILALPSDGAMGKVYALERLAANTRIVGDLDLSCGGRDKDTCSRRPNYNWMKIVGPVDTDTMAGWPTWQGNTFEGSRLFEARFENVSLYQADFTDTMMQSVAFENARMADISFTRAVLTGGSFHRTRLEWVDFTDADVSGTDFTKADIAAALNISGTSFCDFWEGEMRCAKVSQAFFDAAWFYADNPPVNVEYLAGEYRLNPSCARGAPTKRHPMAADYLPPTSCATYIYNEGTLQFLPPRPPR